MKFLGGRIHKANILVHSLESIYYESIHVEIFNKYEQKRIDSVLRFIDEFFVDEDKRALDFGSGTGNLTIKLLRLGYSVTAIDISPEMCNILRKRCLKFIKSGRLEIINKKVEDLSLDMSEFDLICCYSVLHHLPNYLGVICKLSSFLKRGGIIYLDHELSPLLLEQKTENNIIQIINKIYYISNVFLNKLFRYIKKIEAPPYRIDYTFSDYWANKGRHIEHEKIIKIFLKKKCIRIIRKDYHLHKTWILNPFYYLYKYICKPDTCFWIVIK